MTECYWQNIFLWTIALKEKQYLSASTLRLMLHGTTFWAMSLGNFGQCCHQRATRWDTVPTTDRSKVSKQKFVTHSQKSCPARLLKKLPRAAFVSLSLSSILNSLTLSTHNVDRKWLLWIAAVMQMSWGDPEFWRYTSSGTGKTL